MSSLRCHLFSECVALCLPGIPPAECANTKELQDNFNLDINKYKLKATGHRESGFALIELVSVVVIIGILAAMGIVGFWGFLGKSKKTSCMLELDYIGNIIQQYYYSEGYLPPGLAYLTNRFGATILACKPGTDCSGNPVSADSVHGPGGGNYYTMWTHPNGDCQIYARFSYGDYSQLWAIPLTPPTNWSVDFCFNAGTGATALRGHDYLITNYKAMYLNFC